MLKFEEARRKVIEQVGCARLSPEVETSPAAGALGRVLAQEIKSDRDYPPFHRSVRDGFAVSARGLAKVPATLKVAGEIKAGDDITRFADFAENQCLRIMTGAAVPAAFDAVVMVEHTAEGNSPDEVIVQRAVSPGQHIVPQGSEARAGQVLLRSGTRLGFAELALAAQVGVTQMQVARKPRVAILSTGDEVVAIDATPGPYRIRNSNSVSLSAQTQLAGGEPVLLGNARDEAEDLRAKIFLGLQSDILVLSGGVSMGKYDLVEQVLRDLGAKFFFDSVAIRPGKPAVFARCANTFVFGLPGNPISTMVTFMLLVVPAIDLLSGAGARPLPIVEAYLSERLQEKPGLTHFLPSLVEWSTGAARVKPIRWQGSGDIAAMSQANCFLLVSADREKIEAGERVSILLRPDVT